MSSKKGTCDLTWGKFGIKGDRQLGTFEIPNKIQNCVFVSPGKQVILICKEKARPN
jgi:hypothetical protein